MAQCTICLRAFCRASKDRQKCRAVAPAPRRLKGPASRSPQTENSRVWANQPDGWQDGFLCFACEDSRARIQESQIRQPPVFSSLFDACEPLAKRIEKQHARNPCKINDSQIKPNSGHGLEEVYGRPPQPA